MATHTIRLIPFDILDAFATTYLSERRVMDRCEVIKSGHLVRYHLSDSELGQLGELALRKEGEQTTMLEWKETPHADDYEMVYWEQYERLEDKRPDWDASRLRVEACKEATELTKLRKRARHRRFRDLERSFDIALRMDRAFAQLAEATLSEREAARESELDTPQTPQGKRGKRSRYSQEEKDETVKDWVRLDPKTTAQTLEDFLCDRFGINYDTFKPLVAKSTFYGWRRDFYNRNPGWRPDKP